MPLLKSVLDDLKCGKNLDVYITATFAVAIGVLGVFGVVETRIVIAATLVVLSVVLFVALANRRNWVDILAHLPSADLGSFGVQAGYESLPNDVMDSRFRSAANEIWIFQTWIPEEIQVPSLLEAVRRGIKLKVLLINPASLVTQQRLADIGYPKTTDRPVKMLEGLKVKIHRAGVADGNVEIRWYEALPPFCLYLVDDWMLVGFSWQGRPNMRGPHLAVFGRSSVMGRAISDTFQDIWDRANPVCLTAEGICDNGTKPN